MMRMRYGTSALLVAAICGTTARARLGETTGECAERYGEPIREEKLSDDRLVQVFEKNGITVRASYTRARAWLFFPFWRADDIVFSRTDPESGRKLPLADDEIQTLLAANADGFSWREIDMTIEAARETDVEQQSRILHEGMVRTRWRRSDGAMAVYGRRDNELHLRAASFSENEGRAGAAEGLEGF
jgi:hypothetical protein